MMLSQSSCCTLAVINASCQPLFHLRGLASCHGCHLTHASIIISHMEHHGGITATRRKGKIRISVMEQKEWRGRAIVASTANGASASVWSEFSGGNGKRH